jgi:geranylgeranyl pyrophosphate synthase
MLPDDPSEEEARELIACEDRPQYLDGVDRSQLARALWKPIREMTDRGGKSWRSYAALACCDVVEGDSRKFVQWLAVPELLHVGSLIIDDVEDRSTVRRGGPACHVVHGEPIAINAGTAAYFLAQRLLVTSEVSNADKLTLYDLYFEAMRAGHAGQAIDLDGMADLMPEVVEGGDPSVLERRILAVHRLKTAAPAAALARMGAVAGGGSRAQIEAVGQFFEALGLAFQIVDDVLNLRGFKGNLKTRGEDIANGVVTLPVAKAMGRLSRLDRRELWKTLQSRPSDLRIISATVEKLETCGAIEACAVEARERVEAAWQIADPLLPDSLPKIMLRAFGWYVLERHY